MTFLKVLSYIGIFILIIVILTTLIAVYNPLLREYNSLIEEHGANYSYNNELITQEDINHLPQIVQKYLTYTNVVGTEKVVSYKVDMTGEMRMNEAGEFQSVTVSQNTFINPSVRLFYMSMSIMGLPINGLHDYIDGEARMRIRLLNTYQVVNATGQEMDIAETVTFLNDMFLLAPGSLIEDRLTFEEVEENVVRVTFVKDEITVGALVYFNEEGKLLNFVSEDRYYIEGKECRLVKWSTPITEYRENNGMYLPHKGSAVWNFEDRGFEYIKLNIGKVTIN